MALLNINPAAVLPTAMWAVVRLLLIKKTAVSREEVAGLLCPPSLVGEKESRLLQPALIGLRDLRLVTLGEKVELTESVSKQRPRLFDDFADLLRRSVLDETLNEDLAVNDEQVGPKDLTRALCWVLSRDPLGEELTWESAQQLQVGVLPDEVGLPVVNDTRWPPLAVWATALGFGDAPLKQAGGGLALVPDPTRAVREHVLRTFDSGATTTVVAFLSQLRAAFPILGGGAYSVALGLPHDSSHVDRATSFALLRLEDEKQLRLERQADARDVLLVADPDASGGYRTVSNITILGARRV